MPLKKFQKIDLVLDCCAEPAIEVSKKDPDRVINTNLIGTFNILKKCINDKAKIIFLSSSRVYSIPDLRRIIKSSNIKKPLKIKNKIDENFSTKGVRSLYGLTKLGSEELIKEINYISNIKYIINRLGVISGPWQFGKQDQGFVSMWVGKHFFKKKLSYIGFGGYGNQVRDIIHINDVCDIILKEIKSINRINNQVFNMTYETLYKKNIIYAPAIPLQDIFEKTKIPLRILSIEDNYVKAKTNIYNINEMSIVKKKNGISLKLLTNKYFSAKFIYSGKILIDYSFSGTEE